MAEVMAVPRFERFFRTAAGLDVDKEDLRRYSDFVNQKLYDLLVIGEAHAKANVRDIVETWDLPITKGLQESIHRFRDLDEDIELKPILEQLAALPPLDLSIGEEVRERLSEIVGGLSLALARTFTVLDPELKNPRTEHWDRAIRVFQLLL
ncbi:DUF1931 family protein [Microbispora sp. ATCC PTA-5024]|uniref:DUF1931 family protein n=1 Tax=Microbispora sp. ATCC PTA-5024 TaxID=316330 RepID=UPI0003FAD729|nr:DUF1931 family protein [Microbispora sp. ATCC PTA-5024]